MVFSAWCNLADATIFIALVILRVLPTDDIRVLTSFNEGISYLLLVLSGHFSRNFLNRLTNFLTQIAFDDFI